jgi:hypothetical protein
MRSAADDQSAEGQGRPHQVWRRLDTLSATTAQASYHRLKAVVNYKFNWLNNKQLDGPVSSAKTRP